jgi:hypothetical protein
VRRSVSRRVFNSTCQAHRSPSTSTWERGPQLSGIVTVSSGKTLQSIRWVDGNAEMLPPLSSALSGGSMREKSDPVVDARRRATCENGLLIPRNENAEGARRKDIFRSSTKGGRSVAGARGKEEATHWKPPRSTPWEWVRFDQKHRRRRIRTTSARLQSGTKAQRDVRQTCPRIPLTDVERLASCLNAHGERALEEAGPGRRSRREARDERCRR